MLCIILQSLNEYFSLVIMWSRCFWIIFCKCMKFWTYSAWLPDASVTSNFCVKNVAFKVSLKFKCVLVGKIDSPQNPLARHLSVQTVRERFSVWPVNIQDWVPAFAYESHLITATEYRGTFFSPSNSKFYSIQNTLSLKEKDLVTQIDATLFSLYLVLLSLSVRVV